MTAIATSRLTTPRPWLVGVVALLALGLSLAACSGDDGSEDGSDAVTTTTEDLTDRPTQLDDRYSEVGFIPADTPSALAIAPDGSLYIGELASGRISVVPAAQLREEEPIATQIAQVEVSSDGQRGLVGLVLLTDGTLLAGYTQSEAAGARQVVAEVVPGEDPEVVFAGPEAAERSIGGRLALLPDGRVLVGLGDFLRGEADTFSADEPFSKLLSIDPSGPPDQVPEVVSEGWNNPFAFTVGADGAVWVADNAPSDRPERIGRGDGEGPVIELGGERAPSGLALISGDELALCGFVSGTLLLVPIVDGSVQPPSAELSEPCRLGVLTLPDERLAVAVDDGVRILSQR